MVLYTIGENYQLQKNFKLYLSCLFLPFLAFKQLTPYYTFKISLKTHSPFLDTGPFPTIPKIFLDSTVQTPLKRNNFISLLLQKEVVVGGENTYVLLICFYCHIYIRELGFMIIYCSYAQPGEKGLTNLDVLQRQSISLFRHSKMEIIDASIFINGSQQPLLISHNQIYRTVKIRNPVMQHIFYPHVKVFFV